MKTHSAVVTTEEFLAIEEAARVCDDTKLEELLKKYGIPQGTEFFQMILPLSFRHKCVHDGKAVMNVDPRHLGDFIMYEFWPELFRF